MYWFSFIKVSLRLILSTIYTTRVTKATILKGDTILSMILLLCSVSNLYTNIKNKKATSE